MEYLLVFAAGVLIGYLIGRSKNNDDRDRHIDQSGSNAGGDIVGGDKLAAAR